MSCPRGNRIKISVGCVYDLLIFFLSLGLAGSCGVVRIKERVHERKIKTALPKVKTSAKSVQTTRVVCTNFSRSLYRLQLKFAEGYAQMNFSAILSIISVTQKYNYLESRGCISLKSFSLVASNQLFSIIVCSLCLFRKMCVLFIE